VHFIEGAFKSLVVKYSEPTPSFISPESSRKTWEKEEL